MKVIIKPLFWVRWSQGLAVFSTVAACFDVGAGQWNYLIMQLTALGANVALISFWRLREK